MKLAPANKVKSLRVKHRISQATLAARIGASQSRVAKIGAGDPSVSLDLLVRAALAAGGSKREVAKALGWQLYDIEPTLDSIIQQFELAT